MATWREFTLAAPPIASAAERLIFLRDQFPTFTAGLAYLATVRRDGGPRVHPISPALLDGRLCAFILRASPKSRDLRLDPRYALHSLPYPLSVEFTDEEIYVVGRAAPLDRSQTERVAALTHDDPKEGDGSELDIERVMHKQRTPGRPLYSTWRADRAAGIGSA